MATPRITAIVLLALYLTLVLLVGIAVGRRSTTSGAWQFGAKGLSVFGVIAILLGTRVGAASTVGLVENVYETGLVAFSFILGQIVGSTLCGFTTGRLFYRTKMMTLPAFTAVRFGKRLMVFYIVLDMVIGLAVNGLQVLGVGLIIQSMTGLPLVWGVIIGSTLGWIYLTFGGLSATASTNLIHLIVCFVGIFVGLILLMGKLPLAEAFASMPDEFLQPFTPAMTMVSWMIVGVAISLIANVYHSPLAAGGSEKKAIAASVATGWIYGAFGLIVTISGIYAAAYFAPVYEQATGEALSGAIAFGTIANYMGNPDTGGSTLGLVVGTMMMAGVIGAIISTMAPLAWAIATVLSRDIYKRLIRPDATGAQELFAARAFSTIYWLVPGLIALVIDRGLLDTLLFLLELPVGAVFAGFLVYYWDRVNEPAAFWAVATSVSAGVVHKLIELGWLERLFGALGPGSLEAWGPWFGSSIGWIVTSSALVFFTVLFLTPPPSAEQIEVVRRARLDLEPLDSAPGRKLEERIAKG